MLLINDLVDLCNFEMNWTVLSTFNSPAVHGRETRKSFVSIGLLRPYRYIWEGHECPALIKNLSLLTPSARGGSASGGEEVGY